MPDRPGNFRQLGAAIGVTRTVARRAFVLLFIVGVTVGCSDNKNRTTPDELNLVRSGLGLLTAQQKVEADTAEWNRQEREIKACMEGSGYKYVPVKLSDVKSLDITAQSSRFSGDYIDAHAFGASETPSAIETTSSAVDENQRILDSLSPAGQQSMMSAFAKCESLRGAASDVPAQLDALLLRLHGDDSYLAAEATWSACATEKGFPFASYDAAAAEFQQRASDIGLSDPVRLRPLQDEERATAQALRSCTIAFGLVRAEALERILISSDAVK